MSGANQWDSGDIVRAHNVTQLLHGWVIVFPSNTPHC